MSINQPLLQVAASGGSEGNNDELAITVPRESEEKEQEKEEMASTDYNQCAEEFLQTNPEEGLSSEEAQRRLQMYGVNALPEETKDPCMEFLGHFWGPMPIMIWVAIAIEILLACLEGKATSTLDAGILFVLQLMNGLVGWYEGRKADDAIAALKSALSPRCSVVRDGREISGYDASQLVPGDIVKLAFGNAVPADCKILGKREIRVDQAALTGESIPKRMGKGDVAKMGSTLTDGECEAVVVATGSHTFFGRTAALINTASNETGHFQKLLWKITAVLVAFALVIVTIIFVVIISKNKSLNAARVFLKATSISVVVLVSSIPIAMQVVCLTTLAVGAKRLAQEKAIVKRLGAIEELASMSMLCSDKTGTLTTGKMTMDLPKSAAAFAAAGQEETVAEGDTPDKEVVRSALLAAKWEDEPKDAIDRMLFGYDEDLRSSLVSEWELLDFEPFSPSTKRTSAVVRKRSSGEVFRFVKGAPQIILSICDENAGTKSRIDDEINALAKAGVRALAVARCKVIGQWPSQDEETKSGQSVTESEYSFVGLLTFRDPPRHDSKATIERANQLGVLVKKITGDRLDIGISTALDLGMSDNILGADVLPSNVESVDPESPIAETMESADGFAEVFPEHKYMIVQTLRKRGWVTAMTGDGVNDAPALKRADIGIAVEGSTDAARAAADIVLSAPGLSTIVTAIYYSRKIFQRMKNYVVYRIACTLQLVLFIFVGVISVDPSKYNFGGRRNTTVPDAFDGLLQHRHEIPTGGSSPMQEYFTMPVIALVLITILNDGCIVAISHDNVVPGPKPESWAMHKTTTVAIVLAFVACISSVILLFLAMENGNDVVDAGYTVFSNFGIHPFRSYSEVQIVMYLKISLSDFLTVFSARTTNFFTSRRPGYALLTAACVAMGLSTILAVYWPDLSGGNSEGDDGEPLSINGVGQGWRIALFVWVYCIICFLIQDLVKVFTYSIIDNFFSGDEDAAKAVALKKSETRNLMSRKDEVARDHSHASSAERKAMFKRSLSDAGHVQSISFESDGNAVDESAYSGRRRSISITNEYRGGWRSMVPAILRRIRKLEKKVVDLQQQVDNKKDK